MGFLNQLHSDIFHTFRRSAIQRRNFRQRIAIFQSFQIGKYRLFDQPVRRAVNFVSRFFKPVACTFIQLHAHRRHTHAQTLHIKNFR
ncbi:hypothetical protein SRABI106_04576 [Rahnella aquatilis]|nr:hypothetical protein SRABI106_04576 [Rahnella aquatilis]